MRLSIGGMEERNVRVHASRERAFPLRDECRMTASDLMIDSNTAKGRKSLMKKTV